MLDIDEVSVKVKKLGALIDAPKDLLTVYSRPIGDGSPHLEISEEGYFYVSSERGCEIFRKKAVTEDEILYLILRDVIWEMANDYEINNRIPGKDSRRVLFSKKIELMRKISNEWADKEELEISEILECAPYDDNE